MSNVILYCLAFGALLGGIDHILGNRFGLGQRFEEAFRLLGPIALSMAGILCLAPLLSSLLGTVVVPLFRALRFDPGMFGSILAIDMGGYQMSMALKSFLVVKLKRTRSSGSHQVTLAIFVSRTFPSVKPQSLHVLGVWQVDFCQSYLQM